VGRSEPELGDAKVGDGDGDQADHQVPVEVNAV